MKNYFCFTERQTPCEPLRPIARAVLVSTMGLAVANLAVTNTANAEETAVTLPKVEVKADTTNESPTGPIFGFVAKRSLTATKTNTPLVEVPQSISVIGRDEFDARGAQSLEEAIRYTPGVTANTSGADSRGYEFFTIRGFDADPSNFRDGLKQSSFGNSVGLTEVYGLERVEVLRGPSSGLFGRGDASGVVNRVSKMPSADALRQVELEYGSFNYRQAAFDVGDRLTADGSVSARVVGLGRESDSNNAEYSNGDELENERRYIAPSLRWQPSAATSLTVLGEFLKNQAADDIWYIDGPDGEPTELLEGDPNYSQIEQFQRAVGYRFEHQFNDTWTFRQNLRYSRTNTDKHHIWALDGWTEDGILPRTAVRHKDELTQTTVDTQLQLNLHGNSVQHTVLLGVDWSKVRGDIQGWTGPGPDLDPSAPVYGVDIDEPTEIERDYEQTTPQVGFYVQDQIKLEKHWVFTLGGRRDVVRMEFDDDTPSQRDSAFSGRAGATYLVGNGWAPYISYAESFHPTLGADDAGNAFDPSRGKQWELGVKFQPQNHNFLFTAALFDLNKTNVVTYDELTYEARQTGKIRSRGVELELKAELTEKLTATASYTYMDVEVRESANDDEIGKTPIQVPDSTASAWLDYKLGGGFSAGAGARFVDQRWNDELNTSSQSSFTLFDAAARFETGPWIFALNTTNLFDKEYVMSRSYGYYLGHERNVTLNAKYRW